jgi:hypothetical protein
MVHCTFVRFLINQALRDFFVRSIPDVGGAVKALRLARRTLALGASTSVQLLQLWKASKDVSEASPDLRRDFDIKKIFEESDGGAVSISTAAAAEMEKALVKALQDLDTTVAQGNFLSLTLHLRIFNSSVFS